MNLTQLIRQGTRRLMTLVIALLWVIPAVAQIKPERTDPGVTAKSIL